jgi:LPS export ABC transporter protein LptC
MVISGIFLKIVLKDYLGGEMANRCCLIILILLVLAVPIFSAKSVKKQTTDSKRDSKIQMDSKGVTLNWIEKGKLRMSAKAEEFKGDEITGIGKLINFTAKLYENGILKAEISADKAVADTNKRIVTAEGNIKMKSSIRTTSLKASKIKWFAKDQKVIGLKADIESSMGNMQAPAFEADTALKSITLKNSVKGF